MSYSTGMKNTSKTKNRILTGDNTTGKLHLGHYVGSLENRVDLQDKYETFIILADMHALAYPKYVNNPEFVAKSTLDVLIDNLAVGLDPGKVTFFAESKIPEIYELATIFSMLITYNRTLRNPTIKQEIKDKELGDTFSMGFLNFPILQAADILCVKANLVPVGEDQLAHIELTNEIAKKFNSAYGKIFNEVKGKTGRVKRLVGLNGGAKMTKSLGNCIYLSDSKDNIAKKVMGMYTDPKRIHPTDPGTVEGNPVFIYHDAFNVNKDEVEDLKKRYKEGRVGDVAVKEKLVKAINNFLDPIREKRSYYNSHLNEVKEILQEGTKKTRSRAQETLKEVRGIMGLM